jgi:hypothetical protein
MGNEVICDVRRVCDLLKPTLHSVPSSVFHPSQHCTPRTPGRCVGWRVPGCYKKGYWKHGEVAGNLPLGVDFVGSGPGCMGGSRALDGEGPLVLPPILSRVAPSAAAQFLWASTSHLEKYGWIGDFQAFLKNSFSFLDPAPQQLHNLKNKQYS